MKLKNQKKIAFIAYGLSDGGAERVASIISNYLVNHDCFVLFIAVYSDKKEYFLDEKIKYVYIDTKSKNTMFKLIERNKAIYKHLKDNNINIAISFLKNEIVYSLHKKIKIIYSLRNNPENEVKGLIKTKLRKYVYRKAKHIVFQTPGAMNYYNKDKILNKSSIIVNPIDTNNLPKWNGNNSKTFITACRLTKQKNLPFLIQSFVLFHQKHQDYLLEIYGDGEEYDMLKKLINQLNAETFIFLLGHKKEIHYIMQKSFCFVLVSDYEGLSNSMLEALTIGMPCICTDCPPGGAKMFITDNKNGFLINVRDQDKLVEKMEYLVNNNDKLDIISNHARAIQSQVKIEKVCQQWYELLSNLVD